MTSALTPVALFVVAAFLVGFSKTAVGGLASISVAIFATLLPAKESTAAILLLLLTGDVVAVWHYRHECDWSLLRRLLPAVLPGLGLGALFLALVDDTVLRRSIGVVLVVLVALQLWLRWRGPGESTLPHSRSAALGAGVAAGFTTMTANAAGGVMTVYLVARGVGKLRFLGTGAWFFLIVNLCKLPFSAGLGLFHPDSFVRAALLAPVVLLGCWCGIHTVRRISQRRFDQAVLVASALAAVPLIVH